MNRLIKFCVVAIACLPYLFASAATKSDEVVLEVMDPRGDVPPPKFHAPSERVSNLDGKTVGIYWIGKAGGDNFWDGVEELLNDKYPNTRTVRYRGPFTVEDAQANKIAKEVDTLFYGVGD